MNPLKSIFNVISRTSLWVWFSRRILSHWTLRVMGYPDSAISSYPTIARRLMQAEPLDVYTFCTCDRKTPVALLIKAVTGGRFSHTGFIIDHATIFDSRSDGVRYRNLFTLIAQADDFAIIRYRFRDTECQRIFQSRLVESIGKPYDFTQELGGESLYCSELVYTLLNGLVEENLEPRFIQGQRGFSPTDVYNSGHVAFDHNPGGSK